MFRTSAGQIGSILELGETTVKREPVNLRRSRRLLFIGSLRRFKIVLRKCQFSIRRHLLQLNVFAENTEKKTEKTSAKKSQYRANVSFFLIDN